MRVASVRRFRAESASLARRGEPVLVTKHGRISGLFLPLEKPDILPLDLRRELLNKVGAAIWKKLVEKGVTETEIQRDFEAFRKHRGRR